MFSGFTSNESPDCTLSTGKLVEAAHFNGKAVTRGISAGTDARGCVITRNEPG